MWNILQIIFWTLIPTFELRASIPVGIYILDMNWLTVFFLAVITNIILGMIVYTLLDWIMIIIMKIPFVNNLWQKYVDKTQEKSDAGVDI